MGRAIHRAPWGRTHGVFVSITNDRHRGRTQKAYFFHVHANEWFWPRLQAAQIPEVFAGLTHAKYFHKRKHPLSTTAKDIEASTAGGTSIKPSKKKKNEGKTTTNPGKLSTAIWFQEANTAATLLLFKRLDFMQKGKVRLPWKEAISHDSA